MSTRKTAKLAAVGTAAKPETKAVPLVNVWDVYGEEIGPLLTAELAWDLGHDTTWEGASGIAFRAESWHWIFFACLIQDAGEAGADDLLSFADVLEHHVKRIRAAAAAKRAALAAA